MPKFPQWLVAELVLEHRLMDPRHVPGPCHPWLPASLSAPGSQPLPSSSAGPAPSKEAGTKARFPLSDAVEEGAWAASVVDQQDNALSLQFSSPAHAPIGLYRLSLEASTGYQGSSFVLGHFTLLFNAWCPGEPHSIHGQVGDRQGSTHPCRPLRLGESKWTERGPLCAALCSASQKPCDVGTLVIPIYRGTDRLVEAK